MNQRSAYIALLLLLAATQRCAAQRIHLRGIEGRYDAVVLVADANSGKILGGAHAGEAHDRSYHPGSLFKLAIAVAALRSGGFDRSYTYRCVGKDTIAGTVRRCWDHRGHATIGFSRALALSCNLYFRHVAHMVPMREIVQAARSIGMTPSPTDDPLPLEALDDESILGAAYTVSPAQMVTVALALASRGRLAPGGGDLYSAAYKPLYDGLRECVLNGTAKAAWSPRYTLGGKTGTSEVPGQADQTVGWFIGFAPFNHPRYAIVVMYRHARGVEAAAIARKVLEQLL
ncbi:MAG TPA: penicillin-binding transpeptidase domain-containing protein [Candidatus Kapabacteria bacterium]|nr:penicillin-binding transpeptidase domain-containing protein [Candidatus Kapabacteria bacterium]